MVYRGPAIPSLDGVYVFGDFCSGEVFGIRSDGDGEIVPLDVPRVDRLTSFGIDSDGELYALSRSGGILRVAGA